MNEFALSLLLLGALSTGGPLPFWSTAGQWGLMPEGSGALALVQAGTQYDPAKDFQWKWGVSLGANLAEAGSMPALDRTVERVMIRDSRPEAGMTGPPISA